MLAWNSYNIFSDRCRLRRMEFVVVVLSLCFWNFLPLFHNAVRTVLMLTMIFDTAMYASWWMPTHIGMHFGCFKYYRPIERRLDATERVIITCASTIINYYCYFCFKFVDWPCNFPSIFSVYSLFIAHCSCSLMITMQCNYNNNLKCN